MNPVTSVSLKQQAQAFLRGVGLYERLKTSCIYDLYWSYTDPRWITDRTREIQFYKTVLSGFRKNDLIFDIGANDGTKTDVFLRLGARVVAVEPDETNLRIIRNKFIRNRIFSKPVIIEGKAVSDRTGTMHMFIESPGSALNTLSPKWASTLRKDETRFSQLFNFAAEKIVETTTLQNLMERHGIPYYLKIDVEGHELNVLQGLKCPVPYLSFEVNLPDFMNEGIECVRLLNKLQPGAEFNFTTDCRTGLNLQSWMPERDFLNIFNQCKEPSIEIFCRT